MSKIINSSLGCFASIVVLVLAIILILFRLSMHIPPEPLECFSQGTVTKEIDGKSRDIKLQFAAPIDDRIRFRLLVTPRTAEDAKSVLEKVAAFRIRMFDVEGHRMKELIVLAKELKLSNSVNDGRSLCHVGDFTHDCGDLGAFLSRLGKWEAILEENGAVK